MTVKKVFSDLRKELKKYKGLNNNMAESFIKSIESIEKFILNRFDRREIVLIQDSDEIYAIANTIGEDYYVEFDSGYDFYCRVVDTINIYSKRKTLYVFLYDLKNLS